MKLNRDQLKRRLLQVLASHTCRDDCISMTQLVPAVLGDYVIPNKRYDQSRIVRSLVAQCRREGAPICIRSGKYGGYFLATNPEELEHTAKWFRKRAMSSLKQEALLRGMAISDLVEQISLDLTTDKGVSENA